MKKLKFLSGFTMAEAILVMTILGIIATIVLSTLKPAQFKEKALQILAKKVMTEIDNATTQILINDSKHGDMMSLMDSDGTMFEFGNDADKTLELYKKYLATTRKEVSPNSYCTRAKGKDFKSSAIYLKDGACIGIVAFISGHSNTLIFPGDSETFYNRIDQGAILFDTNGEEEPNTPGKDQFNIPIANDGIMWDWDTHAQDCRIQDHESSGTANVNCCKTYDENCKCIECYPKNKTCTGVMNKNNVCTKVLY